MLYVGFKLNFLAIFTFILIATFFAISVKPSSDTYWHLAYGKQIWQTKTVPKTDPFIYSSNDTKVNTTEWLSGLIFYLSYKLARLNGLIALRVLLGLGTIYFLYLCIKLVISNRNLQLTATLLAAYILAYRLFDRPENFSYFFVAFTSFVCLKFYLKKTLSRLAYLLPLVFLLWPNLHGFSAFGLGLFFIFTLAPFLETKLQKFKWPHLKSLFIIFFLSCIASFIQFDRFFYFKIASNNQFGNNEFVSFGQRLLVTNGHQFFNQISYAAYFYIFFTTAYLCLFLLFVIKNLKRPTPAWLIFCFYALVLFLPLKIYRMLTLSTISALPIAAYLLKEVHRVNIPAYVEKLVFGLLLAVITYSILTIQIFGERENTWQITLFGGPKESQPYYAVSFRNWKPLFPQQASAFIKQNLETKHLFTGISWSSYFIWNVPGTKVFSDILWDRQTQQNVEDEKTLQEGRDGWQKDLEKYAIDTVVNAQSLTFYNNRTPVYELPGWKLVYIDDNAIVYAKNEVIKNTGVDLSAIHPEIQDGQKFKKEDEATAIKQLEALKNFDQKNSFARQQLVEYWTPKDLPKAKDLAQESRQILPKDPIFPLELAVIYTAENDCQQAKQFAREALAKSFNNAVIKNELNRTVATCLDPGGLKF